MLKQKLGQLPLSKKVNVVKEGSQNVLVRVYPKPETVNGELARSVAELAVKENWRFDELHTEEGRLDEVFRNITMPDTAQKEERK